MDGSSPPLPAWRRVSLAAYMFLVTAIVGVLQPFVPLYLEAAGISKAQFGFILGVGPGLALLIQPLLGRLSDRLPTRRPVIIGATLLGGLAYLGYRSVEGMIAFALLTVLGSNSLSYLNAAGGVLVGQIAGGRGGAAYAGYRVWGSVGYIVVTVPLGWLASRAAATGQGAFTRDALSAVFLCVPLLFAAIALVTLLVPDRRSVRPHPPAPSPSIGRGGEEGDVGRDARADDANLNRFLVAFFLYTFSLYGASAYISLFLKALGATPLWITCVFAAGVVCEVLVMTRVGRLSDTYGRRPILAVTFLLMPLRLLLYIPATGPLWVLAVQMLHGINFGIMGTIAIVFVNDLATDHNRGAAMARLSGTQGLATAFGPAACGLIAELWGIGWMFAATSLVGALAAALFLTLVRESHPAARSLPGIAGRWLSGGE